MSSSCCWCYLATFALAWSAAGAESHGAATQPTRPDAVQATSADTKSPARPSTNILGLPAAPLTEPIDTDRPDVTDSPFTVPYGHVQLEGGYAFTYNHEAHERSRDHTLPQWLLRVGLVENLELRVGWDGFSFTEERIAGQTESGCRQRRTMHEDGGSDLYVGSKIHLVDQRGWVPALALIPGMLLPTGAASKTSGDVDPETVLAWSHDLGEKWTLSGNVILACPTAPSGRFFQTTPTIDLEYEITERLEAYTEYVAIRPATRGSEAAHTLGAGLLFLITDNVQVDWSVTVGLNGEAQDFSTGVGLSFRF